MEIATNPMPVIAGIIKSHGLECTDELTPSGAAIKSFLRMGEIDLNHGEMLRKILGTLEEILVVRHCSQRGVRPYSQSEVWH